ncbi:MAG: GyrI-like domain-containing protein [Planctomycetes bacterium]|nr:GyrI-like domain-containing protein [Planctomycetota bacterium]
MTGDKINLFTLHKAEYAQPKKPTFVEVGPARYFAIDGVGIDASGSMDDDSEFGHRIGALYAAAYTTKFTCKAGGKDFVVSKLEAFWGRDGLSDEAFAALPKEEWPWRMAVRVPEFVGARELKAAQKQLREKGNPSPFDDVQIVKLKEGRCVQMLHLGPYDREGETLAHMQAFAEREGLAFRGLHHEIYVSDPRRVEPERLKTILRRPVG